MATNRVDIDRVIREVLRRLQQTEAPRAADSDLVLTTRVVSTHQLEGQLTGIRNVRVPKRAVITPAARDLLRQHDIALQVESELLADEIPLTHLMIGQATCDFEPNGLLAALGGSGIQVEQIARTGLIDGMEEICSAVSLGGRLGLMLTTEVHAAVCLANRHRAVRAAQVTNAAETASALNSVAANLLVIDPSGIGTFELRRIIDLFCENPNRSCCEPLQVALG